MTRTKYGKHLIHGPFMKIEHYTGTSMLAHDGEYDADVCIGLHCLVDTRYKAEMPHTHDFHELLCFIGGNPKDITDFGAEIEITLGEEREVHLINSTTVVSIPPGLLHCPLIVKKCDPNRPVSFLEISLTRRWPPMSDRINKMKPEELAKFPPEMLEKMPADVIKQIDPKKLAIIKANKKK
jgi:hypothetical protein